MRVKAQEQRNRELQDKVKELMVEHECTEETRITRNEDDIQDLWKLLEALKDTMNYRLPLWATFLIAALSSACTGLLVRSFT